MTSSNGPSACHILLLLVGALFATLAQGAPVSNSCLYAYDGECDEGYGTRMCDDGTDTWDCRRIGPPPGPESCYLSHNGECDTPEPAGTGLCLPNTDTADCRAAGIEDNDVLFFGHDDRVWPLPATESPWSMVGRITFASGGHCTGTLVGPATVLTAAHCLFLDDGQVDPPEMFLAGASGADYVARAAILKQYLPDEYDLMEHLETSNLDGKDYAFLILDQPIGDQVGWLDILPLTTKDLDAAVAGRWLPIQQGGYSADSTAFLSVNLKCPIVEVWGDGTFYHECDSLKGDSGAPLLVKKDGHYWIVAIDSSFFYDDETHEEVNMAVDARAFRQDARRVLRRGAPNEE